MKIALILAGPIMAGIGVSILATTSSLSENVGEDLMLAFGETQDYVNLVVLSVSMVVTTVCLIMIQRSELETADEDTPDKSCPALTFTAGAKCDKNENVEAVAPPTQSYTPQMFRHTLLLMLLCCSMFSGAALSMSRIANIWDTEGAFPGVYKVLIFLDTFLASGQGLLFLAVFALDCKYILLPISKGVHYVKEKLQGQGNHLPTWISMDSKSSSTL